MISGIVPPGYAHTMIPADAGKSLADLIRSTLFNVDQWDQVAMDGEEERVGRSTVDLSHKKTYRERFEEGLTHIAARQGWSPAGCAQVRALKLQRPPNKLYRIKGGLHSATKGTAPIALIVSYRPGQKGGPAECGMAILGFSNDLEGSVAHPIGIPAEGLEDVTEAARAGTLPELRVP